MNFSKNSVQFHLNSIKKIFNGILERIPNIFNKLLRAIKIIKKNLKIEFRFKFEEKRIF